MPTAGADVRVAARQEPHRRRRAGRKEGRAIDNWDEIRTAYQVARVGTVSGAAEQLGVHHATVIRHIDALEGRLGTRLFQRHPRGYTPTEAGEDLLRVAAATDDQFSQLSGRIRGQGNEVAGDLVVTSLDSLVPWLTPMLARFQRKHDKVRLRYLTGTRLFRLEYGEAHVAIRAGGPPDQLDNVAQRLPDQSMGLYASQDYVARHGIPAGPADYPRHRFIGPEDRDSRAPHYKWLHAQVPQAAITFRCAEAAVSDAALRAGAGIGFLAAREAAACPDLVEIHAPRPEWSGALWLVTHVDLHRTTKVQALSGFLKQNMQAETP